MIRVHVICEGQTEEMFIKEVLADTFLSQGIYLCPSLIGKPGHKGGNLKFERLFVDVQARLLGDTASYCTTFFDFYGLSEDFPGKVQAAEQRGAAKKADCLLDALTKKLQESLGQEPLRRFIPYVQMHEFEGLLFSQPMGLARAIYQISLATDLQGIRESFETPEDINNSQMTAPSRLIMKLYAAYDKPLHGSLAAIEIGLPMIRQECRLFDAWLRRIEALKETAAVAY